jgi:hypothetical protein
MTRHHHGRGPYWATVGEEVDRVAEMMDRTAQLVDVAEASTQALLKIIGWHGTMIRSSEFIVSSERSARLADLTLAVGATDYICGTGGAGYLQAHSFTERGLAIRYFSVPEAQTSDIWRGAKRVSAIAAISDAGAASLGRSLGALGAAISPTIV